MVELPLATWTPSALLEKVAVSPASIAILLAILCKLEAFHGQASSSQRSASSG